MTDTREVISALIDGETVDPNAVGDILEAPANRALLLDFLPLRSLAQADSGTAPVWTDAFSALETAAGSRRDGRLRAAAVIALLTAGAVGGTWVERFFTREGPPEPHRVVELRLVERR